MGNKTCMFIRPIQPRVHSKLKRTRASQIKISLSDILVSDTCIQFRIVITEFFLLHTMSSKQVPDCSKIVDCFGTFFSAFEVYKFNTHFPDQQGHLFEHFLKFKNSFFPCTIPLWNSLPATLDQSFFYFSF